MKSLTKIAIRILSLTFFLRALQYFPLLLTSFSFDSGITSLSNFSMLVVVMGIGAFLWMYSVQIAEKIVGNTDECVNVNTNLENLQIAAFSVIGVFVFVNTLPLIISNILTIYHLSKITNSDLPMQNINDIIGNVAKLLLSIWLILSSKSIVHWLRKLKTAGIDSVEEEINLRISDKTNEQ